MSGRDVMMVILGAVVGDALFLGCAMLTEWLRDRSANRERRWRR